MIIVSGTIPVAKDKVYEATQLMRWMMAETARETGCITYRFYTDIENPALFRVFEQWESDEALAAHFDAPHMQEFNSQASAMLAGAPEVMKYSVSGEQKLR